MKKRVLGLVLAFVLLIVQVPSAHAAVEDSGQCGEDVTWTLDDSGTLTISGTGPMVNSGSAEGPPWNARREQILAVAIKNGVTSIVSRAFMDCTMLINVMIPNSVTSIGEVSFRGCTSLTSITIPNSVTSIGDGAFSGCTSLKSITIPNSVTSIGSSAFYSCTSLTSITIPNSVTSIESWTFMGCKNLKSITIPNSVTSIERSAFRDCKNLTSITIPNSVTSIGDDAFYNCTSITSIEVDRTNLAFSSVNGVLFDKSRTQLIAYPTANNAVSYVIPSTVTSIGDDAFRDCKNLTSITIPNSVINIGEYAFCHCDNLINITIPNSVTSIRLAAFHMCDNLKNVYFNGSQSQWKSIIIGDDNDSLTDATIYYNSQIPDDASTMPIPQINSGISKYTYSFTNAYSSFGYSTSYRIPLQIFQLIYGNTALAKQKYVQSFSEGGYWAGSCYGIGTTAGMFACDGNGVNITSFRNGAARPGDLKVSDSNSEWGLTLTQFIEAMQISQYGSSSAVAKQQNMNHLSDLTSAVTPYDNGGCSPVLVCVYGPDRKGNYSGHALLAYHLDGEKLYVYDSNHPEDGTRVVTISNSGWSYTISDGVTWNDSNGDITYVPYETYLSDWTNRGHVQGSAYVSLVADVSDAAVTDSSGNTTAVFQRGKMIQGSKSAYPVTHLGITADGVSTAPPQVAVWLPADEVYTVTNRDTSKSSYEVSLYNVNQGVSVQTNAPSVTLLAEDATSATSAIVESTNCDYSITQVSGQNEVTLIGKTGRDKLISIIENGVSTMRSGLTASTSVTVNGKPVSVDSLPNNETAVNLLHGGFDDVTEDQYFYKPVQWAVGRGITNGTSATTFSPQNTCSRNHILTFLWRANGSSEATIQNPFTDINPNADFGKAAVWAYENGLVSGTKLNGETPCTRSDVVTYLWKLAGRPAVGRNGFTDVPSDADYAQAVSWAVERGITKGTSETTFNPSGICTRGQIVTFLYRAYADN